MAVQPQPSAPPDNHYFLVVKAMAGGRIVPFLGAGVNLCGRPGDLSFEAGKSRFLPRGSELAETLASAFGYANKTEKLTRISQYISVMAGRDWLYETLHKVFAAEYEPNDVHDFLATLPRKLFREKEVDPSYQLIATTNWDDALERAFDRASERYHLVWYISDGANSGLFLHRAPDAKEPVVVTSPNDYDAVSTKDCTVILKVHGAVDRTRDDVTGDSYVITEDHYIDYLTRGASIATLVPIKLAEELSKRQFLFLGYSLDDWNLRVMLNRIWRERTVANQSWAIQKEADDVDRKAWQSRSVDIRLEELGDYVAQLRDQVREYRHGE